MRTDTGRLVLAAAGALALGGCVTDDATYGKVNNWGEANRQTMAAQVIDPDPQYDNAVPASSGDHAADAVDRYNNDKVKKPDKVRTTTVGSGGGGSGGTSGGN